MIVPGVLIALALMGGGGYLIYDGYGKDNEGSRIPGIVLLIVGILLMFPAIKMKRFKI